MPRPPADAPLLSSELIYTTALRLIDEDGLESLSMRKLAGELGVTPRSLYHYVPTKDALLGEVYKVVLAELELPNPQTGDWQTNLRELGRSFRALCQRHQNVAPYFLAGHDPVGRDTAIFEVLFRLLSAAGLPDSQIVAVSRSLVTFLTGYILAEFHEMFTLQNFGARQGLARKTPEAYPVLLNLPAPAASADENFEVALTLLVAGIEGLALRPN